MNIALSTFAPENLVLRDGFGSPVPLRPGAYLRDSSRVPRRRPFIYLFIPSYDIGSFPSLSESMDQPGKVGNPARGQLNRENHIFLVPMRAPESLVGLARRVRPSRPASACLFSTFRLNLMLFFLFLFLSSHLSPMDLIITILPVVTKDLPISPRFTPYNFFIAMQVQHSYNSSTNG